VCHLERRRRRKTEFPDLGHLPPPEGTQSTEPYWMTVWACISE
jgi:hypothetical protein